MLDLSKRLCEGLRILRRWVLKQQILQRSTKKIINFLEAHDSQIFHQNVFSLTLISEVYLLTSFRPELFERLKSEETDPRVRNDPDYCWHKASIECHKSLVIDNSSKNVEQISVLAHSGHSHDSACSVQGISQGLPRDACHGPRDEVEVRRTIYASPI